MRQAKETKTAVKKTPKKAANVNEEIKTNKRTKGQEKTSTPVTESKKQEKKPSSNNNKPVEVIKTAKVVEEKTKKQPVELIVGKSKVVDKKLKQQEEDKKSLSKKRTREEVKNTEEVVNKNTASNLGPIKRTQIEKSCEALLQHIEEFSRLKKAKLTLPGVSKESSSIFLQIGVRNMPEEALRTFKGRPIRVPFPFRDMETGTICLFVKDKEEAKKWLGDDYEKHGIKKIISLQQLRTKHGTFQARRELADLYDYFLADDRIVCMLPKCLGKAFYVGPKRPLPIRFAKSGNFETKVKKALSSAYFYPSGVSSTIRVGTTDLTSNQLVENIAAVVSGAIEHIPGKWKGLQNVFVKSEKSVALPIYEHIEKQ